jgi:hypothetical protein
MLSRPPCYMLSRLPSYMLSLPPSYMCSRPPSHMRSRPPSYMCTRPPRGWVERKLIFNVFSVFFFWLSGRSFHRFHVIQHALGQRPGDSLYLASVTCILFSLHKPLRRAESNSPLGGATPPPRRAKPKARARQVSSTKVKCTCGAPTHLERCGLRRNNVVRNPGSDVGVTPSEVSLLDSAKPSWWIALRVRPSRLR